MPRHLVPARWWDAEMSAAFVPNKARILVAHYQVDVVAHRAAGPYPRAPAPDEHRVRYDGQYLVEDGARELRLLRRVERVRHWQPRVGDRARL